MKITIEMYSEELLPHQRGALAMLLNPVAPVPLEGADERVAADWTVQEPLVRADVKLQVGDEVVTADGHFGVVEEVESVENDRTFVEFKSGTTLMRNYFNNGAYWAHVKSDYDIVSVNGRAID